MAPTPSCFRRVNKYSANFTVGVILTGDLNGCGSISRAAPGNIKVLFVERVSGNKRS